jgi:signal transduction histidine kinase
MIEDLLDLTRIRQAGGLSLQLGTADMHGIVQRAAEELQTGFPDRQIVTDLDGDLEGVWDSERLCQVLTNLVGNAVHHGAADQPVNILADGTQSKTVAVTVRNRGAIPPELLPHLFNPFRGRERPPGRHQGLGLGLFIADQIVRTHGGRIEVQSAHDVTQFRVELPRVSRPLRSQESV